MSFFPGMKIANYFPNAILKEGTYKSTATISQASSIYTSLAGKLTVSSKPNGLTEYSIVHPIAGLAGTPSINGEIIGKVVKISPRIVTVQILVADGRVCERGGYMGIIRLHHISPSTKDLGQGHLENSRTSSIVYASFRPGDILRATVLALAESNLYYLSTIEDRLGVLVAFSASSGQRMHPVSASDMQCPTTGQRESRKVAMP